MAKKTYLAIVKIMGSPESHKKGTITNPVYYFKGMIRDVPVTGNLKDFFSEENCEHWRAFIHVEGEGNWEYTYNDGDIECGVSEEPGGDGDYRDISFWLLYGAIGRDINDCFARMCLPFRIRDYELR